MGAVPPAGPSPNPGQGSGTQGGTCGCDCSSGQHHQVALGLHRPPRKASAGGGLPAGPHFPTCPADTGRLWWMKSPQTLGSPGSPAVHSVPLLPVGPGEGPPPHPRQRSLEKTFPTHWLQAATCATHQGKLTMCVSFTLGQRNWTSLTTGELPGVDDINLHVPKAEKTALFPKPVFLGGQEELDISRPRPGGLWLPVMPKPRGEAVEARSGSHRNRRARVCPTLGIPAPPPSGLEMSERAGFPTDSPECRVLAAPSHGPGPGVAGLWGRLWRDRPQRLPTLAAARSRLSAWQRLTAGERAFLLRPTQAPWAASPGAGVHPGHQEGA